jgi:hypothetical protein
VLLLALHGLSVFTSGAYAGAVLYLFGVHAAIDTALIILIYQYNTTLYRQQNTIAQLRKRKSIILSVKQGVVLLLFTLGAIYCILSPGLARIFSCFSF